MILTTVKNIKEIEEFENIIIPPQGYELYHFTDFIFYKEDVKHLDENIASNVHSLLPNFLSLYQFRIIKRVVVTNKLPIIDDDEKDSPADNYSKVVSSKTVSQEIYKQMMKLRNEKKLRGVGLISTVTQNSTRNTTLFELSSIMFKLSQRFATFNNKTNGFLDAISKMTKTKVTKKILIINTTTSCYKLSSFIRSLLKEIIMKRSNHSIFNYDYVFFSLHDHTNLKHIVTYIVNTQRLVNVTRVLAKIITLSMTHSQVDEKKKKEIIDEINEKIRQITSDDVPDTIKEKVTKVVNRNLNIVSALQTNADIKNFAKYTLSKAVNELDEADSDNEELLKNKNKKNAVFKPNDNQEKESEYEKLDDEDILENASRLEKEIEIDKFKDVTDKELKDEINNLLSIKFERVKPPHQNTISKSMADVGYVKDVSNVHTSHSDSLHVIKNMISMYNKTYWKKLGYNVEIDSITPAIKGLYGRASHLQEMKLKIKYGKKIFNVKVDIPDFSDNGISWINNTPRVLINQLYTLPIVNVDQGEVIFKTMYSSLIVSLITKNKVTFYEAYLMGKKIPVFILMILLKDFDTIMKDMNIQGYKIIHNENLSEYKNEYIKIKISKDASIIFNTSKIHRHQLFFINTIKVFTRMYDQEKFTYFGESNFWSNVCSMIIQPKLYHLIKNMEVIFIDPFTKLTLKHYSLPTNIYEIILYMIFATMDANIAEDNDITTKRVRNHEIISILLFKNLNSSILAHTTKLKNNITLPKDCILNDLLFGDASSQFQMVQQDYNPLFYSSAKSKVTYKGLDGIKNVNNTLRNLHPSMQCIVDPVDTSENASVGETQHLTIDTNIENIFGNVNHKTCYGVSITTSILPFHKHNDGNRVQMADTQIKQALPLSTSERPFVSTGTEPLISSLTSGIFIVRSKTDGKVIEANEKYIVIEDEKKKKHVYILGSQYTTQTRINQTPIVNIGDEVKANQIIAENKNFFDNGFYKYGVNARVVYMNYLGYGIEDGLIISESFAKRLKSVKTVHSESCTIEIPVDAKIRYVRKEKGEVKKGEDLIVIIIKKDLYKNILGEINFAAIITYEDDYVIMKLKSQKDGIIEDIEVYKGKNGLHPELKDVYNEFTKEHTQKEDTSKIQHYFASPTEKTLHQKGQVEIPENNILVYRIVYNEEAILGDKLTNRHAAKGIISLILPDDKMPRDEEGPFDMIYNPYSILGRKNMGQLIELWLGECIRKVNKEIKSLYENKKFDEIKKLIHNVVNTTIKNKKYKEHLLNFYDTKFKELLEDIVQHGFTLPVGIENEVTLQNVTKLMKDLNITGLKKVYVPELGTYTKQLCNCGTLYIAKLQQKVETKYRQRSIGLYDSKTGQAVQGRRLEGGSKIGEYDCYSLISHGATNIIKELYTVMSDDHESKFKLLTNIVEKGSCKLKDLNIKSMSSNIAMLYILGLHGLEIDV